MTNNIKFGNRETVRIYSPEDVANHCLVNASTFKMVNEFLDETIDSYGLVRKYPYDKDTIPYCFQNTSSNLWGEPVVVHRFRTSDKMDGLRIIVRGEYEERAISEVEKRFEDSELPIRRIEVKRNPAYKTNSSRREFPTIIYGYITKPKTNSAEESASKISERGVTSFVTDSAWQESLGSVLGKKVVLV